MSGQPAPCTTGTEAICKCTTAPLICTFDELDGFEFDMNTFSHLVDGPEPMCPGVNNTTSNNPHWISFIAICQSLTVKVTYTNCAGGAGCQGVQAAVYSNCSLDPNSVVDVGCGTSPSGCVNNSSRTLIMTNLIQGKTYHLLVDGCCGSACHINIEVLSPPCPPTLGNWSAPMIGPDVLCVNQVGSYSYETITGGISYFWTVDTVYQTPVDKIEDTPIASFSRDWAFSTPGIYKLCVDALNDCIPFSAEPAPLCKTIMVGDGFCDTDGDGIEDSSDNCPSISNPDQLDCNNNGIGDICELPDTDCDGVFDNVDNCINKSNINQDDTDGDGIGDVCDNCVSESNPDQLDCNNNGIGDICELLDSDCDGVFDNVDNCVLVYNPFQTDQNNNGIGDACEDFPKVGLNTNNPLTELHLANGTLYIDNPEKGIILKNHQGQCFILKMNGNALEAVPIPCP